MPLHANVFIIHWTNSGAIGEPRRMGLLADLRFALRGFRRYPAFPLAAFWLLAVTIGANASVFTLVKSILLQPLAIRRPQELVTLEEVRQDGTKYPFNIPFFLELKRRATGVSDVAAYGGVNVNLAVESAPERVLGVRASANYFSMLGIEAKCGRLLQPDDDAPGRPKVIVISDALWRRRFAADPAAIGRQIRVNGEPHTVAGVLPPGFQFKNPGQEFAVPLAAETDPMRGAWTSTSFLRVQARLKPGVTLSQAGSALNDLAGRIRQEHPGETEMIAAIEVMSLQKFLTGDSQTMLAVLMGAVALVLLIACANISSLALTRSAGRRKELSIRAALGASDWRIWRQILVENMVLFAAGGAGGILLGLWGVDLLLLLLPADLPRLHEVHMDGTVAAAAFATALLCGLVFGAIPALRVRSTDLQPTLRLGQGTAGSRGRTLLRTALVVAETALSVILLGGAGLVLESFHKITSVDPGFRADRLVTFRLALPSTRYKTAASITQFHDALLREVGSLGEIEAVGSVSILPLSGPSASTDFTIDGATPVSPKEKPSAEYRMADPGYFRSMSIPIRRGRGFTVGDAASTEPVAVISETLAARYWKDKDPVGGTIRVEDNYGSGRQLKVIGIVGNTREASLEELPPGVLYVAMPQIPPSAVRFLANSMFWAIRTSGPFDPSGRVRRAIGRLDPDIAVASSSMNEYVARVVASRRFLLRILAGFAVIGLLLAAGGLYALVSFSNTQRSREFGVRIALGARRGDLALLVLREGLSLAAAGVGAGILITLAVSRYAAPLLFEVSPRDPSVIGRAAAILLAAAATACIVPVRRAVRSDPVECLRSE
jgi:predicted permease